MNKIVNKFCLLMAISLIVTAFTSCNDDDDKVTDYAQKIVGTYNGSMNVSAVGQNQTIPDVDIVITRTAENQATLSFNETISIAGGTVQLPLNVSCPAIASDNGDGKTKIAGSQTVNFSPPIEIPTIGPIGQLTITIEGTIDGKGYADLDIKAMLGAITVKFTGQKK